MVGQIISSGLELLGGTVNLINSERERKYGRLPDWLSPSDYNKKDYTIEIAIVLLVLLIGFTLFRITKK